MFDNLTPLQRKLSALFSQGMCRHLAPGRAHVPRMGKGSRLPASRTQDRCGTSGPPVLTDSWPQESARGGNALGWHQHLALRARTQQNPEQGIPKASRTLSTTFPKPAEPWAGVPCLTLVFINTELSCSPGRMVVSCLLSMAQKGNRGQGISAPTLVSHTFRSSTSTTCVTQISAE